MGLLLHDSPAPALNGFCEAASYSSPVPWIGLYIAAATMVCFFCMSFDLVHAFIHKKPFMPCKLFPMNAFTLTVLGVATKLPVDLTTCMPRIEDQLSKLTSIGLLCTSLGFYVPSLGTMDTSERYGNMAALTVTVITMVVNVCMQLGTGVIFAFRIEHLIIMVSILLLLLFMWSSAIAFRGQTEFWPTYYRSRPSLDPKNNEKDVKGLRKLLLKFHVLNYTGNPQTLLCETSNHHTISFLCSLSSLVILQAMLRSFSRFSAPTFESSDYQWSIPYLIVAQILTIAMGTFAIICRWFSLLIHTDPTSDDNVLWAHKKEYSPERELEHLKLKTSSLRFLNKSLSNGFLIAKDFIMDALIRTQIVLYTCSSLFIAIPIYTVKKLLECLLPFEHVFPENTEEIENMLQQLSTSGSKITMQDIILEFALSSLGGTFDSWITKKAIADMMRWSNKCKSDCPTNLIQLISKSECKRGENGDFKTKLEEKGTQFFTRFDNEGNFVYRVSCVSVLVLSSFLEEFMATSRWESLRQSLNESFEILEYVDKSNTPNMGDETRWTSTKELWAHWENSKHWFRTKIISQAFKKKSKKSESGDVLKEACCTIEKDFEVDGNVLIDTKGAGGPLASKHENLIKAEFVIISKFLGAEEYENLYDFLEKCFVQMLCYFLSNLPLAILKEIDGDDPTEIGEGRVRKALKFLVELELLSDKLGDKIKWSWSDKSDPANQGNDENLITRLVARQCGSEVNKAEISIVVDRKVDNIDASLAATSAGRDDDGDTIREI